MKDHDKQADLFAVDMEALRREARAAVRQEVLEQVRLEVRDDLRAMVEKHRDEGIRCPICAQWAREYRRPLNRTMGEALVALVEAGKAATAAQDRDPSAPAFASVYVHVRDVAFRGADVRVAGGELAKLQHWGLIEPEPNPEDDTQRCSGRWRPTEKGMAFADGRRIVLGHAKTREGVRAGLAMYFVTLDEPELMAQCELLIAALGVEHFFNIQLIGPHFIEINPRISTIVFQEDFNLPWLGVKWALGLIYGDEAAAQASRLRPGRTARRDFDQVELDA